MCRYKNKLTSLPNYGNMVRFAFMIAIAKHGAIIVNTVGNN